jgi:hypothetical protein
MVAAGDSLGLLLRRERNVRDLGDLRPEIHRLACSSKTASVYWINVAANRRSRLL